MSWLRGKPHVGSSADPPPAKLPRVEVPGVCFVCVVCPLAAVLGHYIYFLHSLVFPVCRRRWNTSRRPRRLLISSAVSCRAGRWCIASVLKSAMQRGQSMLCARTAEWPAAGCTARTRPSPSRCGETGRDRLACARKRRTLVATSTTHALSGLRSAASAWKSCR